MYKDFWGNDALDFGKLRDLTQRYKDKILVTVTNKPFGESYLLFCCSPDMRESADSYLADYNAKMSARGITSYGAGITLGADLESARMDGFQGGAEF